MNDPSIRDRWLGAICYLCFLVAIPIFQPGKSQFLARHCRQGFALLFAEVIVIIALMIVNATIGQIWLIGFLVMLILPLALCLTALVLSVLGFTHALAGEDWRIPFLDDFADKVPIHGQ